MVHYPLYQVELPQQPESVAFVNGFLTRDLTVFYRLKAQDRYFMPVGIFDGVDRFIFDHQFFIDEKPEYYCFANETQNMTGAEVFAMFAPVAELKE